MNEYSNTSYNITSPQPLYAGSYTELLFEVENPYSKEVPNLTFANNISFAVSFFGSYNSETALKFTKRDNIGGLPRITIDPVKKNLMAVYLYSEDTVDWEDGFYDFQITLNSISGLEDSVIGQGKIQVNKKIV